MCLGKLKFCSTRPLKLCQKFYVVISLLRIGHFCCVIDGRSVMAWLLLCNVDIPSKPKILLRSGMLRKHQISFHLGTQPIWSWKKCYVVNILVHYGHSRCLFSKRSLVHWLFSYSFVMPRKPQISFYMGCTQETSNYLRPRQAKENSNFIPEGQPRACGHAKITTLWNFVCMLVFHATLLLGVPLCLNCCLMVWAHLINLKFHSSQAFLGNLKFKSAWAFLGIKFYSTKVFSWGLKFHYA